LPTFEQADRNKDGYVSRFEARAVRGLEQLLRPAAFVQRLPSFGG